MNLSGVPPEYHDFTNVFSKSKTSQLAFHCKHDLKINLEEGTSPQLGCTYSLSTYKLESLQETFCLLATELDHTLELITDFHLQYLDKPRSHFGP